MEGRKHGRLRGDVRPRRRTPEQAATSRRPRLAGAGTRVFRAADASEGAYSRLRALIVNGLLPPGSPLIETDLAARLGVSRTPVRAALLRLEQEALVLRTAATAGRGSVNGRAVVAPLTVDDLREIFLIVGALEATAVRQVAALDRAHREALAAALEAINDGLRAAVVRRPPDLGTAHDLHVRFHRTSVATGAGPRLQAELDALAPQAERYQRVYSATMMYAADEFAQAHEAVIAAIRAGDADAAERAAGADWRVTAERHCEMVTILGERGNW